MQQQHGFLVSAGGVLRCEDGHRPTQVSGAKGGQIPPLHGRGNGTPLRIKQGLGSLLEQLATTSRRWVRGDGHAAAFKPWLR